MNSEDDDCKGSGKTSPGQEDDPVNLNMEEMISLKSWGAPPRSIVEGGAGEVIVDCGWVRLLFGQTFASSERLVEELRREQPGRRDVAFYIRDPQVLVARAPQDLFIDPSVTYRLALGAGMAAARPLQGIEIRPLSGGWDEYHINRIYKSRGMVSLREDFTASVLTRDELQILIAWDLELGQTVGCVTGVDHVSAFGDPDNGSSLWALAVDPQCRQPGVGRALVLALAAWFRARGRGFMDLSVVHDNREAIALYEKLGFHQVPVYCVKTKNAINESLYVGPREDENLNPYAQIISDEAYRRGIAVEVIDAPAGLFRLSLGGRVVHCRESLTDATSAVAMSRCDDKALTSRLLRRANLRVPAQRELNTEGEALDFLRLHGRIVIKPVRGEQGAGVAVDLQSPADVARAFARARELGEPVLGEEFISGEDLRIIVINHEVVAAAVRKPASIVGDGVHSVSELISKQSRRREAATGGESSIPLDDETQRCVDSAGLAFEDVPPAGQEIAVRKTANLHTGGTLHDVTAELHPALKQAALKAAEVLDIPVVGFDFIVPAPNSPDYVVIEANERPGLANHEPQPTAEKLLDFLFPATVAPRGKKLQ
jgi:GNAT-family acetyltransferase (TIGR03103 family)